MTELRYRAFISYSHSDEAWAKWLHRALESYRVPRNLVGNATRAGQVPARIRPVFRDREDLSSAADLGSTVKEVLAESENLVVICSPAAAGSHWVNEEIRYFAGLGRADKVFCIIVDGEPAANGSVTACFPVALSEIGMQEPLAADARSWADGKQFALLKVVAGLLGLRLDELRQRDLQRRRKRLMFLSAGIVMAIALVTMTLVSRVSERHEREKAEQLATFVVDLGERLQSDADLETLALISSEASRHLQDLNPDKLSPETGKKVALALRQMGRVSQSQGKPEEALVAFERSLGLIEVLNKRYPDTAQLLFELGNAEYYVGNLHLRQGRYEDAMESMQNYYIATRKLVDLEPGNPDWIMELSFSHNNLAALPMESGRGVNEETLFHVTEATRLMESVVAIKPDDKTVVDGYATVVAWAANAQYQACNLEENYNLRNKVLALAKTATLADLANNDLKKRYAYAINGVANAQIVRGRVVEAESNLRLAESLLQQLSAADPSNLYFKQKALSHRSKLAMLLVDTGQPGSAQMMEEIQAVFESDVDLESMNMDLHEEYIDFLLSYVSLEARLGDTETANRYLSEAIAIQNSRSDRMLGDIHNLKNSVMTRYLYWLINGSDNFDSFPKIPKIERGPQNKFRSCDEADAAARQYIIVQDQEGAAREVAYLQSRGYADPEFISFCRRHDLC